MEDFAAVLINVVQDTALHYIALYNVVQFSGV